jgi:serine/threonine-protein kinase
VVIDEAPGDASRFLAEVPAGLAVGSAIAGYRLQGQLGRGGMAVVFRARDERLSRLVALKILSPELAADEAFRRRFIRESRLAAAVDDPHIIPVFEAGEASGVLFIAMRYVPGGDVRTLLQREGPLSAERTTAIITPLASALEAAHAAGLVHRDVKPANMLVDSRAGRPDHVYLSDFGLSKGTAFSRGLTTSGQFLGTLNYCSPEQITGRPVDGRADQYALACAAFEMLTGVPPFQHDEAAAVMYAQLSGPPPLLTSLRPDLPPAADRVVATALAKAPQDRYAGCREFADALRSALGFQPVDLRPGVVHATQYLPAQGDWSPAAGTAREDLPAAGATVRAVPGAPAPDTRRVEAQRGRRRRAPRRRRLVLVALAGIVGLGAAGIGAKAILAGPPPSPAPRPASFPITATSDATPVNGQVWVTYQAGKDADAQIRGEIKSTASGEVARLYAQPFPYRSAPAPAGSQDLRPAGLTTRYAFQVRPSLATRYTVELFRSSTATTPLASSASQTVYVSKNWTWSKPQSCNSSTCREMIKLRVLVPSSALKSELTQKVYPYFGLELGRIQEPAAPEWLQLGAGDPHVTTRQVSADEFDMTISFSFRIGNHAFAWNWNACQMDTEALDGLGLPGHHGCGDQRIPTSPNYLG